MADSGQGRVAVITGASAGIGKALGLALVRQGWHVIGHGRAAGRTQAAETELRAAAAPGARIDMVRGDLALMADTARLAREIAQLTDRVHVLINNAGGVRADCVITPEGNEATFAGNHLGHFLLTQRLLPALRAAAAGAQDTAGAARILSVSSDGHEGCSGIDWKDLQLVHAWNTGRSYCLAKLCNILFTRELARRLGGEGIAAHAVHPGVVDSNFVNHADARMRAYIQTLAARTPEQGADTVLWLATSPEQGRDNGSYFHDRRAIAPSTAAQDPETAARLWDESEKLIARAGV